MWFIYIYHPRTGRYDFLAVVGTLGTAEEIRGQGKPPKRKDSPHRVALSLEGAEELHLIG